MRVPYLLIRTLPFVDMLLFGFEILFQSGGSNFSCSLILLLVGRKLLHSDTAPKVSNSRDQSAQL